MSVAFTFVIFIAVSIAFGLLIFMVLRSRRGVGPWRDAEDIAMMEPYFRREVVEAKVKSLFPHHATDEILRLLDAAPSHWGQERVQLAILKLSKGDLKRLRHNVETAQHNFIKVISSAEYPKATRIGFLNVARLPDYLREFIQNSDFRQYMAWLKKR
jgi:hypothetical protein